MLLKLHVKLSPGWALIQVNFDPIQEIGPKVGGGHSFVSGPLFRETTVFTRGGVHVLLEDYVTHATSWGQLCHFHRAPKLHFPFHPTVVGMCS